ncbi:hypothetical protein NW762_013432 [Fusarium torreyae]|uniref:Cytochrome P450 n=1 Tax=Fusarium torreyae TaxID=1237075 RepID=A0A9W8V8S1_9HYPO|nr:hypothetical protein NW762_013432 [Fusarium torreyae]
MALSEVWQMLRDALMPVEKHSLYVLAAILFGVLAVAYILYQRLLHPLARYPGPFWASITNSWQSLEWLTWYQPYRLADLHAKHGRFVRYGPNKISVTSPEAIQIIFVKGVKTFHKSNFYDTFGLKSNPNIFNNRNQETHAVRRRLFLKSFSPQAVATYESTIDEQLAVMRSKIRYCCEQREPFDLKKMLYHFMCDAISSLMLSNTYGIQHTGAEELVPDDHHINISAVASGAWPLMHWLLVLNFFTPFPRAWRAFHSNFTCFKWVASCVKSRIDEISKGHRPECRDVLSRLILNNNEETDQSKKVNEAQLIAETFGFVIAGIPPASGTMALLFWNLLHNPDIMRDVVKEIDERLPNMGPQDNPYTSSAVESNLPFLRNCVKENFRINPVFTMPLERKVTEDQGVTLDGQLFPKGTIIAVSNYSFHHDPTVWGDDHMVFDPSRWEGGSMKELSKLMMHFSVGGRQCIGKALATTIIYKTIGTILSEFSFELADPKEKRDAEMGLFRGKVAKQYSVGISDLSGPLMVVGKARNQSK